MCNQTAHFTALLPFLEPCCAGPPFGELTKRNILPNYFHFVTHAARGPPSGSRFEEHGSPTGTFCRVVSISRSMLRWATPEQPFGEHGSLNGTFYRILPFCDPCCAGPAQQQPLWGRCVTQRHILPNYLHFVTHAAAGRPSSCPFGEHGSPNGTFC